jgi:hypothetical protein
MRRIGVVVIGVCALAIGAPAARALTIDMVPHSVSSGNTPTALPCQLGGEGGESWIILRMPDDQAAYAGNLWWLEDEDITVGPGVQVFGLMNPSEYGDRLSSPTGDMLPKAFQCPYDYNRRYKYLRVEACWGISSLTLVQALNCVVVNGAPVANAGGPYIAFATSWDGADVVLDASASTDPDGDSLSYAWDFDGDGEPDSTDVKPTAFFPCGQTSVALTVSDGNGGTASAITTVTIGYQEVTIDVKPGDTQNVINMGSSGVIPVAFLSSATFDATTIQPATVALRGEDYVVENLVRMRGKNGSIPQAITTDVDGDGLVDLLVHIETEKLADCDIETEITLGAETSSGQVVLGTDTLTVIHQE